MKKIVENVKKVVLVGVLSFSIIMSNTSMSMAQVVNSDEYVGYHLFNDINIYNNNINNKHNGVVEKVISDKELEIFTKNIKNFTETYIPKEIGNVDIFISNIVYKNKNSYYEAMRKDRSASIIMGGNSFEEFINVFAEHFAYTSLESYNTSKWAYYESLTGGKKDPNNNDVERNSLFNSFKEDFMLYIDYSFNLKPFIELRDSKKNNYLLTMDTFEYFDLCFPEIKELRLSNEYLVNKYRSKTSDWARSSVVNFFSNGFELEGENLKSELLTRQDFAIMLSDVMEKLGYQIDPSDPFNDTSNIKVRKAATLGIINGTGYNQFTPNKPITRREMIVILDRFQNVSGIQIDVERTNLDQQVSKEIGVIVIERICNNANLLNIY